MPTSNPEERYFETDAFKFLSDLSRNNNREWFQKNKARYENAVQTPALRFIEAMGLRLSKLSPHIVADARPFGGSLSRIYRDTRFSKDKAPYKTHVGIHFAHDRATKEENLPGFFLHLAPGESMVASGVWHPVPSALKRIRDSIVASPTKWKKVLDGGLAIEGESYVRVPVGYDAEDPHSDDLRRKDFFATRPIPDREVVGVRFGTTFEAACRQLDPLNAFLADAVGVPW
ncbi:MAG: DUF2461 domain-containing protein [Thermoplasmata archaeon]|nr:DUF2461 domain-containing protein [Thermoplasmata archaeon]